MFTGIVTDLGQVDTIERTADGERITVATGLTGELSTGDSIAVNGVCLTATTIDADTFTAEVMNQTLTLTSLGELDDGALVNLELPVRATDRLGGHIVQGHIDGVGTVAEIAEDGFARRITIDAPESVLRYVVHKGSICVDGVSLTVAELAEGSFTVSLIPETLERTNLGTAVAGTTVNLEADVLAKYVERLIAR